MAWFLFVQKSNPTMHSLKSRCSNCSAHFRCTPKRGTRWLWMHLSTTRLHLHTRVLPILCTCMKLVSSFLLQRRSGQVHRFSKLLQELRCSKILEFSASILAFINCLIAASDGLDQRVKIRNQLLGEFIAYSQLCIQ